MRDSEESVTIRGAGCREEKLKKVSGAMESIQGENSHREERGNGRITGLIERAPWREAVT